MIIFVFFGHYLSFLVVAGRYWCILFIDDIVTGRYYHHWLLLVVRIIIGCYWSLLVYVR